jgi:hypothetical protein
MVTLAGNLFGRIAAFSNRKFLVCALMAILPIAIRVPALRVLPFPTPAIHDEFSYLLGADTIASGRLTNPPQPMWVHFETFHENFQPTYGSKYPPAQALFLAFGQRFLGHPWFGVCISFGLMCGCLCWMLQGWLPPVYALLGSVVAMSQFGFFGYWMDSYWGGAVAAIGGSLVLGAVPRLARSTKASVSVLCASILGSVGLMILANSRPYEGVVLSLAAVIGLLWWRRRLGRRWTKLTALRVLIPCFLICLAGFSWMAYYNYRVTGNPLLMPYVLYERMYAASPIFYLLHLPAEPVYRHEMLRKFWVEWEKLYYLGTRHKPLRTVLSFWEVLPFFASSLLFFPALAGVIAFAKNPKMRIVIGLLAALWAALLLEKSWLAHYFAPGAGLLLIPTMYSLRWVRVACGRGRRSAGEAAILLFVVCCFCRGVFFESIRNRRTRPPTPQEQATKQVQAAGRKGERQLVIVRYLPYHNPHVEFVFNRADIDHSSIVWARDMGDEKNRELIAYYPDRQVWLLEPDSPSLTVTPYSGKDPTH